MSFTPTTKVQLLTAVNIWIGGDTTTNGDINNWDVSKITDMSGIFKDKTSFNSAISNWDTSNVTNMEEMFAGAIAFDKDITARLTASVDIGNPGVVGTSLYDAVNGTWTIKGGGSDIWGSSDGFHYVYKNINGDFDVSCRVIEEGATTSPSEWRKGGIMARNNSNVGSQQASMLWTGSGKPHANWRYSANGQTDHSTDAAGSLPEYIRLKRVGNVFSMYYSENGSAWTQQGTNKTISMNDTILIGLAVCPVDNSHYLTLKFGNLSGWAMTDVGLWSTSKVSNMKSMFYGASSFNQDIGDWNVNNVTDMSSMFQGASNFNKVIANWGVNNVTNMSSMFHGASNFNKVIANWSVNNVTNMSYMFKDASGFNQDIGNWNVNNVTDMSYMFKNAEDFNKLIQYWDTSKVTTMTSMFENATQFNKSINTYVDKDLVISADIGNVGAAGSSSYNASTNTWTITGSGYDIWDTYDQFHYVYREITGDFDVSCRMVGEVTSTTTSTNPWRKSGIMARNNTAIGSQHASIMWSGHGKAHSVWRAAVNGVTDHYSPDVGLLPKYIRLKRVGNVFSMYYSENGSIWVANGSTTNVMNDTILIGLAVCAVQNPNFLTMKFDNFSGWTLTDTITTSWSTSKVNNMSYMFKNADAFNQDISNWDLSSVTNTTGMFADEAALGVVNAVANATVSKTTAAVVNLPPADQTAIIEVATKLVQQKDNLISNIGSFTNTGITGYTATERRSINTAQTNALSGIKALFNPSKVTAAATTLQRKTVIANLKTALNLIISSAGVNSIEIDASQLVLSGTYDPTDKIIVAKANTTVRDPVGEPPANFYSTLSNNGDWVEREYNADVILGETSFTIKILRKDVGTEERYELSIVGNSTTWTKLNAIRDDDGVDWSGRFDATDGSGYLLVGDKITFSATQSGVYIIIGSAESSTNGSSICFLGDTKVKTDQGLIRFDTLTLDNTINNYKIKRISKVKNADDHMIFIERNALGENIPNKDTYISRNHGIIIGNHLVRAKTLVNGNTIRKAYRKRDIIYNILTEVYTIIYVNNMPCETLNPADSMVKKYV